MNQDNLRALLEENGIDQNKIDEIVSEYGRVSKIISEGKEDVTESLINNLKTRIMMSDDPREKAALAARIISIGLE